MKTFRIFRLGFCLSLFLGLALATQGHAEEFYTYKDPHGNLVISNKLPPTGSIVLRRQELPEVQQPQEGNATPLNGQSERSAKPPKQR